MGSLSNLYISQSYQSLVHLATNNTASATLIELQDGLGNSIGVAVNTSGDLSLSGSLTASLQNGYMYVGNASGKTTTVATSSLVTNVNTGSLVSTSSFNSYTASTDIRLNNLESTSASLNTSASLALVTASFNTGTRNLTFTKGDSSTFSVNIPDISGSTNTGATLGANTFTGSQTISLSGGEFRITNPDFPSYGTVAFGLSNSSQGGIYFKQSGSLLFEGAPSDNKVTFYGTGSFTRGLQVGPNELFGNNLFIRPIDSLVGLGYPSGSEIGYSIIVGKAIDNTPTRFTQTDVTIDNRLVVTGSFTASLANGYVWVGNSSNISTLATTSSFITDITSLNTFTASANQRLTSIESRTGSYATTGSNTFIGNQTISGSVRVTGSVIGSKVGAYDFDSLFLGSQLGGTTANGTFFGYGSTDYSFILGAYGSGFDNELQIYANNTGIEFRDFNGASYPAWLRLGPNSGTNPSPAFVRGLNVTGSLNTSGSLSLIGPMTLTDRIGGNSSAIVTRSGSMVLVGQGFTSGSADLAHISSSGNFVNFFMKNSNTAADTIISGSGNIFLNPAAPTAGFKRFMTGGNISIGGAGVGIPQISGSMAWSPVIANNVFANSATPLTFRGPVSSSQSLLNNNIFAQGTLTLGASTAATFERATNGTTFTGNILNGTLTAVAHKTAFISSSAMSMTGNMIGGTVNVLADSSSVSIANNTLQSTFTISNSYYNVSATGGGNSLGLSGGCGIFGSNHNLFASGSNTTNATGRQFVSNFIGGYLNSASVNLNGDNSNMIATTIMGHGLSVTGSSALVSAVAKGNSYGSVFIGRHNAEDGNRARTAETIFAVGTGTSTTAKTGFLIDSGSNSYFEGTLNISGSTSMTGSLTIQSGSGDLYVHGHKQFNGGMFQNNTTLSGSAGVSQSIALPVTDLSYGVTIANNSQITMTNAGVYNIQFSAQIEANAGADTVWIWFKKNGTNITDSATKVILPNNTAQTMTVNILVDSAANDYYELVWQNLNGYGKILSEVASGNIPLIPAVIVTVTQVR